MGNAATFSGTLLDLRPRTLLQFLGLTGKSGVLRATGHEHKAAVRFAGGRVVGDDCVAAVVELLRLGHGEFQFEETAGGADADSRSVAEVLVDADAVVAEWEDVSQAIPSIGLVVRLRASGGGVGVCLSADAWDVVATIATGAVTPMALVAHLGWPQLRVCRAVKELVEAGRAELVPPSRPQRALHGRPRAVVAKAEPRAWHAADRPLWPGAAGDFGRARTPWDDPGE
jgi:hypothetical protein